MKAIAGLLFLMAAALARAENGCPPEQATDWTIEKLLRHEDCGKFYQCVHGSPVEMICPAGLHFNELLNICDWPAIANCTDLPTPTTTTGTPETKVDTAIQMHSETGPIVDNSESITEDPEIPEELPETTTKQNIEFQENGCPVDPLIHWLTPHEKDCSLFYSCVWGSKVELTCAPNLHFNKELQVCDWPQAAGCIVNP